METAESPRTLTRHWLALLLAPTCWMLALVVGFILTGDACAQGGRGLLWLTLGLCLAAALAGTVLAWSDRRHFLAQIALGLSAVFAVALVLMFVPVGMLGACRT